MNYKLYIYTNKITKKSYIGVTSTTLDARSGKNGSKYLNLNNEKTDFKHPKFANAILKYGWNSFDRNILVESVSKKEIYNLEKEYIKKYDTYNNGYNSSLGGLGGYSYHSPESNNSRKNKMKIINQKKRELGIYAHGERKVYCIELKKEFNSIREAADILGLKYSSLSTNLKKSIDKNLMCQGYHWKYLEKDNVNRPKKLKVLSNKRKAVLCIENGKIYNSVLDASLEVNAHPSHIKRAANKNWTTAGFHWKYL